MSDDDVVALAAAYIEEELDPVSRSHLDGLIAQDNELATTMGEQMRTHLLLHALLSEGQPSSVVQRARLIPGSFNPTRKKQVIASAQALRPVVKKTKSRIWWTSMTTAAAVAASVITAIIITNFGQSPISDSMATKPATIESQDDVRVVRGTGQPTSSAHGPLLPGDTIITGANQKATLVYNDESTRLSLNSQTRVQALSGQGKRFRLEQGSLAVQAAPQPTQSPLIVQTPQVNVTVIGTSFSLTSDPFLTWLTVDHGSVQLQHNNNSSLLVRAGQRVLAADTLHIIPTNHGCGLIGSYYQGKNLTDLKIKRLDPTINFDWETDEPAPGMTHPFSVRWTGMIEAKFAETYRIYLPSDDGVRLWIDERLVYDNWRVQGYHDNDRRYGTFTFSPDKLRVPIRIEYFENLTFAIIRMSWQSPSQPRQLIPATAFYPEGY